MNDTVKYSQAIAEVEAILRKFNDEKFDIDTLAAEVARATELIALCRERLVVAQQEVDAVLKTE